MSVRRAWVAYGLLAVIASGCGGGGSPSKAPDNPAQPMREESAPTTTSAPAGAPGADTAPRAIAPSGPVPQPAPTFAPPPPMAPTDRETAPRAPSARETNLARARDELRRAEEELDVSTHRDCATACRAVGSMERATRRICDLADAPDDRRRCDDAKKKLASAKQRIRAECGGCSDGTKLD